MKRNGRRRKGGGNGSRERRKRGSGGWKDSILKRELEEWMEVDRLPDCDSYLKKE